MKMNEIIEFDMYWHEHHTPLYTSERTNPVAPVLYCFILGQKGGQYAIPYVIDGEIVILA